MEFYVYAYLDPRKQYHYIYDDLIFNYEPFYIGKGKNDRSKSHLQAHILKNNSIKSNKILKIKKLGLEPIVVILKNNLSYESGIELEINLIKFFGRIDNKTGILTNMTDGGEGFKNVIFTKQTKKKMSLKAIGTKTYANNGMSKKVGKYDLEGNLLEEYSSLRDASEKNNLCMKNISSCAREVSKTAGGFIWKYLGKSYQPKIVVENKDRRKKVYQYDFEGNFIKEWESMSQAEKETKIRHISCVCLGRLNFSGGYQWRYEKFDKIEKLTFEKTKNITRYEK